MSGPFRVALSGDFKKADGSPTFPDFDLQPLISAPNVEMAYIGADNPIKAEQLADFDALILLVPRFGKESIHPNGRLSVVARFGVGYDNVDVPACTDAGIALVITPDGVRRPVAVSIVAFMLALTGKLMIKDKLTRGGPETFNQRAQHMGVGLVGRTLGALGIGNIGAELFRLAKPFGMRHMATDPADRTAIAAELGVELTDRDTLLRQADFIVVYCPLDATTRMMISTREFALMKPSAIFINCARGPIVDETALHAALVERRIAAAGLDVFHDEPVPASNPLLQLENVIVSPHALCYTDECLRLLAEGSFRRAVAFLGRERPPNIVNPDVLAHPRVIDWLPKG